MYTLCPKCSLMLVVTSADLRAAQGHVRCGRCRTVFNALESLIENTAADSPAQASADAASHSAPPPQTSASPPDSGEPSVAAAESDAAQEVWVEPDEPAEQQVHAEETLEIEQREPPTGEASVEETPAAELPTEAASVAQEPPAEEPSIEAASAQAPAIEHAPADGGPADRAPGLEDLFEPSSSAGSSDFELDPASDAHWGRWLAGALVLALVLAGQLVNHYRGTLATLPPVGPAIRAAYGALGIPIVPLWNVRAYQARQLGATVSGSDPHQITVRASIANHGRWPLPLPLLRVTLQDRYGRTIAARDVPPRDYLPSATRSAAMLAPGGRIDATVAFVNPGPQAIGFEIDACLRERASVVCAHGPR